MTPEELAKPGTEHAHQRALFAWAAIAAPYGFAFANDELAYNAKTRAELNQWKAPVPALSRLFAIHNQGHGDQIRGNRAKAEGVKAGVPDVMLPVPRFENGGAWHAGLFIELKRPISSTKKKGRASEAQNDWLPYLCDAGYIARVAFGWREAADIIQAYMTGKEIQC